MQRKTKVQRQPLSKRSNVKKITKADRALVFIPTGIFVNRKLSFLESIVKYLKENQGYTFHEISILINRDERNVWTLYNRVKKKRASVDIEVKPDSLGIPVNVLCDRRLSILEVVVVYLKGTLNLPNNVIGKLLDRSNKTIWTCYSRACKKLAEK